MPKKDKQATAPAKAKQAVMPPVFPRAADGGILLSQHILDIGYDRATIYETADGRPTPYAKAAKAKKAARDAEARAARAANVEAQLRRREEITANVAAALERRRREDEAAATLARAVEALDLGPAAACLGGISK